MKTLNCKSAARRGFTLLELLIAVIILGILVSIVTVVYTNRAADARLAACREDLQSIASGQEHAAIDTGYFYRLYVLNDVKGEEGPPAYGTGDINDKVDAIGDESIHTNSGQKPLIFIDTDSGEIINNAQLITRVKDPNFGWRGPYVNYTRKIINTQDPLNPSWSPNANMTFDLPLDPWGNPYVFFTRAGFIQEPDGLLITTTFTWPGVAKTFDAKNFDRPTLVSMGPDSLPGDNGNTEFGSGDDIIRQF